MARIQACRLRQHMSGPALAALAAVSALTTASALTVAPATAAAASTRPAGAPAAAAGLPAALARVFEAARHLPGSAVGGLRAGSLRTGTAAGTRWAIATFSPARRAGQQLAAGFQDGAGTGVFSWRDGAWRLVRTGPYGCGAGLPATLRRDWGLGTAAACAAVAAPQRAAARRALAALPTPGSAASSGATASPGTASPGAATASPGAATASPGAATASPGPATGSRGLTIAGIALSQVGVSDTPAVTSFAGVDCDPYSTLVAGFSANSDGCGYDQGFRVANENEAWCADFAKWVWQRAGVTADMNTLNAGSVSFYAWGLQQGETMPVDGGTPAVGDAIVFFPPGPVSAGTYADHVGLVTAVNPDGTVSMVNGDFLGAANISVQYDTGISLTSWASQVWGPGEQWVVVAPPGATQQPAPAVSMSGPRTAVTGTAGAFRAQGAEPGGSVSEYYWTFGDGRSTNTTGASVTHVFSEAGRYTVTVTVTSGFGTATTRTWNVSVLGASSAVAAVPSDAVWFATTPVDEYLFTRSAGGLAADTWDGAGWLQAATGGQPSASGGLAALSYPDPAAGYAMTPHAYFRTAGGGLAQTYLSGTGWVTQPLPGHPAAGTAIVAATSAAGSPQVFFTDTGGHLAESALQAGGWVTRTLAGPPGVAPASLALAATAGGVRLFSASRSGQLYVTWPAAGGSRTRPLPGRLGRGTSLTAVTTPAGQARVVFAGARGGLASLTQGPGGAWRPAGLPGAPAAGTALAAANYLLPAGSAGPLGEEMLYLTAGGRPAATFSASPAGGGWQTAALPGTATGLAGVSAYPVTGQPAQVFLAGPGGLREEMASGPSGPWTAVSLPTAPATFADRVVLYAATQADDTAALAAAAAAGLPAAQVTTSFATAWAHALSGGYLVIAVGLPATDALYFNVCGWANPSGDIPGSTPFYIAGGPLDTLPGAGAYEEAAATAAAQTPRLAAGLAYYAVHGALPPGVTSLPAAASPQYACAGSPS